MCLADQDGRPDLPTANGRSRWLVGATALTKVVPSASKGVADRAAGSMRSGGPARDRRPVTTPVNRIAVVALDVAAPLALFYGLRGCGVGDVPALVASVVPPTVSIAATAVRRRSIDALAVAVLAGTALGVAAALLGGGPRELLARGAWFSASAGLWTLATLVRRQPLCYEVTRALLPRRAPVMDRLWENDGAFRAAWRSITVCWGLATLSDSALRIVVAYTLPVATVPIVDAVITIVTVIVLQVPTHLFAPVRALARAVRSAVAGRGSAANTVNSPRSASRRERTVRRRTQIRCVQNVSGRGTRRRGTAVPPTERSPRIVRYEQRGLVACAPLHGPVRPQAVNGSRLGTSHAVAQRCLLLEHQPPPSVHHAVHTRAQCAIAGDAVSTARRRAVGQQRALFASHTTRSSSISKSRHGTLPIQDSVASVRSSTMPGSTITMSGLSNSS